MDLRLPWQVVTVIYFISFLCVVGYFVINMFIGVLVENFQLSMPLVETVPQTVDAHVTIRPPRNAAQWRQRLHQVLANTVALLKCDDLAAYVPNGPFDIAVVLSQFCAPDMIHTGCSQFSTRLKLAEY